MPESHLAELKHQREPKVQHSKPLHHGKPLHAMIYKKTVGLPSPCPKGLCSLCSTPPDSPPLRPHWAPVPCQIHAPPGSPTLRQHCVPDLQVCQITAPPGSHSHHNRRAPNLPNRHRQPGLDVIGVTSEQLRLQFYCFRTGDIFFSPSLRIWLSGLLFDHQPSLPFFFTFFSPLSFFYLSFSFSFFSFSLGFVSINIATKLMLNYT
jgi:hypothetical protein